MCGGCVKGCSGYVGGYGGFSCSVRDCSVMVVDVSNIQNKISHFQLNTQKHKHRIHRL